jgi:hypothetical protein
MPLPEERVWRRWARDALERDENSLEGALGSRSRRGLTRGGRPALERGGVPLEGASEPRARQNFTRGGDWPSSEARLYWGGPVSLERSGVPPEGGQADCLVGRGFVLRVRLGSFASVFYEFKRVPPGCLGDPHGCPRQHACSDLPSYHTRSKNKWVLFNETGEAILS